MLNLYCGVEFLMKNVFALASVAVLLGATAATANDANILSGAPVSSWEGLYVGASGGLTVQRGRSVAAGVAGTSNSSGARLGFFAGYNMLVSPSFLIGVEGDLGYDFSKVKSSGATFGFNGSARARAGFVMDNVLIFAAGGYTATHTQVTNAGVTNGGTLHGWTLGAGADVQLTDELFARAEYRFNEVSGNVTILGIPTSNRARQHVFNVGLGYKF